MKRLKGWGLAAVAAWSVVSGPAAGAGQITNLYSTGQVAGPSGGSTDSVNATPGGVDTHYTYVYTNLSGQTSGATTPAYVSNGLANSWTPNGSNYQWISPGQGGSQGFANGYYTYSTTFTLSNFTPG